MAVDYQRAFQDAIQLHGMLKSMRTQQKQERLAPVTSALSALGTQYGSAQTDEARQQANTLANLTRSNYLAGGGSPADLPTNLWGSNPAQGFQTSQGYEAPITGYEGQKRTDAISNRRNALADLLEREKWGASEEAQPWFLPLKKQTMEATIANTLRSANAPYGGSGSTKAPPTLYDLAKTAAYNDPRLYTGKEDAPEGTWKLEDLISAYSRTYGGGEQPTATPAPDPMIQMIQEAQSLSWPPEKIREGLIGEGVDPSKYGY